jgi:Double zinc ribbon/Adenylate and Guanylate cyclase catalytic domain
VAIPISGKPARYAALKTTPRFASAAAVVPQLGPACPVCGLENPSESKFCGGCGTRLQEVRAEDAGGERRLLLTVLFCDIVGSTVLSQLLDPEKLGQLIAAYQKVCADAVVAHEGYIAQYLGDGVVAYFGYPRAHEDEAQRELSAVGSTSSRASRHCATMRGCLPRLPSMSGSVHTRGASS